MIGEKLILESKKKSFLRSKWEKILQKTILRRIPEEYIKNDQIIFLNSEEEIKKYFLNLKSNNIYKKKIIIIIIPLNNFLNLIKFLDPNLYKEYINIYIY